MDAYRMLLFPLIFIALLQLVFNALTSNSSGIDVAFAQISDPTVPSPSSTWYGQTDFLGYFVAYVDFISLKFIAFFTVLALLLFPFASLIAVIPIAVTGVLTTIFVFLYLMISIGAYKILSPFVGR